MSLVKSSVFGGLTALSFYTLYVFLGDSGFYELGDRFVGEGRPLHTFVGVEQFDGLISLLLNFFSAAGEIGPQASLLLTTFAGLLTAVVGIVGIEASRDSNPALAFTPLAFAVVCQFVGAAVALPLYATFYCLTTGPDPVLGPKYAPIDASVEEKNTHTAHPTPAPPPTSLAAFVSRRIHDPTPQIRAVVPAVVASFVAPLVAMNIEDFTPLTRAWISFSWQIYGPIYAVVYYLMKHYLPAEVDPENAYVKQTRALIYLGTIAFSFHVRAILEAYDLVSHLASAEAAFYYLRDLIVPASLGGPQKSTAEIAYLFLFYDFLLCALAAYAFVILAPGARPSMKRVSMVLRLALYTPFVGPGAAVLWAWYYREATPSEEKK